jgi:hypothetical protein
MAMTDPSDFPRLRRRATIAAAVLGAGLAGLVTAACLRTLPRDGLGLMLIAGAMLGGGAGLAGFWRLAVPRNGSFSLALAPLAGIAAGLAAHFCVWVIFFVATDWMSIDAAANLAAAFGFTITMMALSVVLVGAVSLPLAVLASLGLTLWCRARMRHAA